MSLTCLVSCEEDILKELNDELSKIEGLDNTKPLEKVALDLYIITDESTTKNAMTTVNDKINQYLKDRKNRKFDTKLTIHYLTADEYASEIDDKTQGIVLITGKDMLQELVSDNRLANLESKYLIHEDNTFKFAKLNATVGKKMLDVARQEITVGSEKETALYFVPNNHVVGSYEYLLINKAYADELHMGSDRAAEVDYARDADGNVIYDGANPTYNERYYELKSAFDAAKSHTDGSGNPDRLIGVNWTDVVKVVTIDEYYKIAEYEENYYCNMLKAPVITEEEAAEAGFAILKDPSINDTQAYYEGTDEANQKYKSYVQSALEIICAINTESELRNLLQYGIEFTNYYTVDGTVVYSTDTATVSTDSTYKMNIEYTGDVFLAKYCVANSDWKWSAQLKESGIKQNSDAVPASR